jgi:hypothetical protein
MLKFKFHSFVDVITNSSTVIYTYQNSVEQAKELVEKMLKLAGITDKTADDIFYYGVFCDDDRYFNHYNDEESEELPYESNNLDMWLKSLKLSIMKGEVEKPNWMNNVENNNSGGWDPDSYLYLISKEDKYKVFGDKICALLNSVSADGGRDG